MRRRYSEIPARESAIRVASSRNLRSYKETEKKIRFQTEVNRSRIKKKLGIWDDIYRWLNPPKQSTPTGTPNTYRQELDRLDRKPVGYVKMEKPEPEKTRSFPPAGDTVNWKKGRPQNNLIVNTRNSAFYLKPEWENRLNNYFTFDEIEAIKQAVLFFNQRPDEGASLLREKEIISALEKAGLMSAEKYNDIHKLHLHEFSENSDKPSPFAQSFPERTNMGPDSVVAEFGCGRGAASLFFAKEYGAKVIMVDVSEYIMEQNKRYIEGKPYEKNIELYCEEYRKFLSNSHQPVTHIFTESSLHYFSPAYLYRHILMPMMGNFDINKNGYLGLSMKTVASDSAKENRHLRLTQAPYYLSIDLIDKILRFYPEEEKIVKLFKKLGYEIIDKYTEKRTGYDKPGENEFMRQIIAISMPENRGNLLYQSNSFNLT